MIHSHFQHVSLLALSVMLAATTATAQNVQVDVNLDMKHSVRGVSDFNRRKHITVHANVHEADWKGEDIAKHYLMNELDVYFGRDNGNASWLFRYTPQDPGKPGTPNLSDLDALNAWFNSTYRDQGASVSTYEHRAGELIMGTNPDVVLPSNNYRKLQGREDKGGRYMLRDSSASADWVAEYLDTLFREESNPGAQLRPKYWEVTNEPDMILNTRNKFFLSSWEALFKYHNLVADKVRRRLGDRAPLIGGMTWGLHDLGDPDFWHRANGEEERRKIISQYYRDPDGPDAREGDREAWQRVYQSMKSEIWNKDVKRPFAQWDYIWKGFIDAAGENMDFYSLHFYDWVGNGEGKNALTRGTYRYGGPVEAVLEMVEWYQQHRFGEPKPWVISEYGSIVGQQNVDMDYHWGDWTHVQTFNRMFMQFLRRPDMIIKSMPFAPIKGTWGYAGDLRYEPSLMQSNSPYADIFKPGTDWYFSDKIQWYQLWSDVDGTRIDMASSDPDIQAEAYVDGQRVFVILNNMERHTSFVDLAFFGAGDNRVASVRIKHSYLAKGLSDKTPGHGVLADATLDVLPETLVVPAGSTIILEVEYSGPIRISHESREIKYYGESLSDAGSEAGAIHRVDQQGNEFVTANVRGVSLPRHGEAVVRVTGQFHGRQMTSLRPDASGFLINGQKIGPRIEIRGEDSNQPQQCYDFMGLDYEGTHHTYLRSFDIPVPLASLKEDNEIKLRVLRGGTYANVNIIVWEMSRDVPRTQEPEPDSAIALSGVSVPDDDLTVGVKQSIAINAAVIPSNASNGVLTWTSDDPKVAVVDANGIVTGIANGKTRVRGKTNDGGFELAKSITVTGVAPNGVKILYGAAATIVGGSHRLFAYVEPWHATNKDVIWTSADSGIATVDQNGVVTGVSPGSITVSASTAKGEHQAKVQVSVTMLHVKDVSITPHFAVLPKGDSIQIEPVWTPGNASNRTATWSSSDLSIATVDSSGRVTALQAGKVTVKAVSADGGFTDTVVIEVSNADAEPFFVEAEKFDGTGGTFEGVKVTEDRRQTNYNQTGDWADYKVRFHEQGTYQILLDAGTPLDGAGVEIFINGTSAGSKSLPNTGDWGKMQRTIVSNALSVSQAGNYTIRLLSTGNANAWQWNADKLGFRMLTSSVKDAARDAQQ